MIDKTTSEDIRKEWYSVKMSRKFLIPYGDDK